MEGGWLNKLWYVHTMETVQSLRRVSQVWMAKPVTFSHDVVSVKEAGHGVVSLI